MRIDLLKTYFYTKKAYLCTVLYSFYLEADGLGAGRTEPFFPFQLVSTSPIRWVSSFTRNAIPAPPERRNLFGTRFDLNIVDKQVDESLDVSKLLESPESPKSITQRIYNELSRLNDYPDFL